MSETTTAVPAIYPSMGRAMRAIRAVDKSRQNEQQRYNFRGIDEVYNELHACLADNDIIMTPAVLQRLQSELVTKSGTRQSHVVEEVEYSFVSCIDGSAIKVGPLWVEALDTSDKASNKCLSFAQKYALLQTFLVPTRDNIPEEDDKEGDRVTIERGERVAQDSGQRKQRATDAWDALGANDEAPPPPPQVQTFPMPGDECDRLPANVADLARGLSTTPFSQQEVDELENTIVVLEDLAAKAKLPKNRAAFAIYRSFAQQALQRRRGAA